MTGGLQPLLNLKDLRGFIIPLPPMDEQNEIVYKLDLLFQQEEKALLMLNKQRSVLDELIQAILTKAFRGELNTNIPLEESANQQIN